MDRQVELVLAEAKRRRSQALLDSSLRLEHLEVADALEAAAKTLERSNICSSETKLPLSPQHLELKKQGLCRGGSQSPGS